MGYASPSAVMVSRLEGANVRLDALLSGSYASITEVLFRDGLVSGDMTNPERINDNLTVDYVNGVAQDRYVEVDFGVPLYIRQFRIYGHVNSDGNNRCKITYWDGSAWVDWVTDISGFEVGDWSAWKAGLLVSTTKIRLISTVFHSSLRFTEMSMKV